MLLPELVGRWCPARRGLPLLGARPRAWLGLQSVRWCQGLLFLARDEKEGRAMGQRGLSRQFPPAGSTPLWPLENNFIVDAGQQKRL